MNTTPQGDRNLTAVIVCVTPLSGPPTVILFKRQKAPLPQAARSPYDHRNGCPAPLKTRDNLSAYPSQKRTPAVGRGESVRCHESEICQQYSQGKAIAVVVFSARSLICLLYQDYFNNSKTKSPHRSQATTTSHPIAAKLINSASDHRCLGTLVLFQGGPTLAMSRFSAAAILRSGTSI